MRILAVVLVAITALPMLAQRGSTSLQPPTPLAAEQVQATGATKSNIVYGTAGKEKLKLDVYLPTPTPPAVSPAVILIHGGAWFEGDKDGMAAMARWLARNGYVAFSINYRLLDGSRNQWPAQLEDAKTAVRWVREHAADYGVDPDHVGVFGHSAGAQMAAMLGVSSNTGSGSSAGLSSDVQAVVDQAGPSDFTSATYKDADSQQYFTQFLGAGEKQDAARWRAASPALNVTTKTPPFLIIHGTRDADVPIVQSEEMRDALKAQGISVTFVTVDDVHTPVTSQARRTIALETLKFFDTTLKHKLKN